MLVVVKLHCFSVDGRLEGGVGVRKCRYSIGDRLNGSGRVRAGCSGCAGAEGDHYKKCGERMLHMFFPFEQTGAM